jgi:hypothetical protein
MKPDAMDLSTFSEKVDLISKPEIEKVRLLAYFALCVRGTSEFTLEDVDNWFDGLSLPRPNRTRLRRRLQKSRQFIHGRTEAGFALHARDVTALASLVPEVRRPTGIGAGTALRLKTETGDYVDRKRLKELRDLPTGSFDLSKLIRLCEDLNYCFLGQCYLAVIMLVRAVIDHVPPVFGCRSFAEVANNYAGTSSFKESMHHLDVSSRKIADQHLHGQVRARESLPTVRQVDFSSDLDVLLGEVVRICK